MDNVGSSKLCTVIQGNGVLCWSCCNKGVIYIVFKAKAACVMSDSKYTDVESGSYKNNPSVSCPAGTKLVGCTGHSL